MQLRYLIFLFVTTPLLIIAQNESVDLFVGLDTLLYKECGTIIIGNESEERDTIAEVKFIRYLDIATDTSTLLTTSNAEIKDWVQQHADGMDAPCSQDLRSFADWYSQGGPFIIYIDHKIGVNRNGLFSVQLTSNKEPCCGISGLTNTTRCWNLDLRNGRTMQLFDVIRPEKKKAFLKLIDKREKEQSLLPDSAGLEKAFDILVQDDRLRIFFNEQWGGMKYYVEVEVRYLEHQHLFQPEFLDRIDLVCRVHDDIVEGRRIYSYVDKPPVYPGGSEALIELVRKELSYTDMFASKSTYVRFVIEPDGWITNTKVIKANSAKAEKEALRFLKRMDRWKPGTCRGKEVPVLFSMPINFGN